MTARILVVEDEPDLAALLDYNLQRERFASEVVYTGADAIERLMRDPRPELVLLDRMLPDVSGDQVLAHLRSDPVVRHVPVIFVSARDAEPDRVEGLALGADDYVVKPFSVRELILRVRAILRRAESDTALVVDPDSLQVRAGARVSQLTPLEVSLVQELRYGTLCTRESLMKCGWASDPSASVEVLDSALKRLRRKLEPLGFTLQSLRSVGFRMEPLPEAA